MSGLPYLNFDLQIERAEPDYRIRVLTSPAGETRPVLFHVPFSDDQVEIFLLRIGRPRRNVRKINTPQVMAIKDFGGRLFEAVFPPEVRVNLAGSLMRADAMDAGLRIRLRLSDCPELSELPWEYLYDGEHNRFLCLSDRTPLVRYLEISDPVRVLPVTPPLRILVVIASPSDYQQLDGEQEWRNVKASLSELVPRGRVEVVRLAQPTLSALQRQLRQDTYHVFHFVGHGAFSADTDGGVLAMEDGHGRARVVGGEELGTLLHDHRSLRLAVLNSCEGARGDRADPFSGTAQSLLQQGIPAVVAMQFEITDDAAITFGRGLYEAIADGYPLDAATAEARKAVYFAGNLTEWGTPVLYSRAPDGRIFDIQDRQEEREDEEQAEQVQRDAAERVEREAAERAEREAAERAEREAAERAEREAAEQAEREAAEQAEREAAEQAEREAAEQAEREAAKQAEREAAKQAEREAAKQAEREAAEQAEREAAKRAEREAAKRAEREAAKRAEREAAKRAEREAAKRAEREAAKRAEREAAERAEREAAKRAEREAAEQAEREAAKQARRLLKEQHEHDTHQLVQSLRQRAARLLSRRWVVVLAVSVLLGGAFMLLTYHSRTILGQLPADLRPSCTATGTSSATCWLADSTVVVFYQLFATDAVAHADVVNGDEQAPASMPCPPSAAPAAETPVVCRYEIGGETGVAAFRRTVKDPQRFYEVRWSPESNPRLRGFISTKNATEQDWEKLRSNWTELAGMH